MASPRRTRAFSSGLAWSAPVSISSTSASAHSPRSLSRTQPPTTRSQPSARLASPTSLSCLVPCAYLYTLRRPESATRLAERILSLNGATVGQNESPPQVTAAGLGGLEVITMQTASHEPARAEPSAAVVRAGRRLAHLRARSVLVDVTVRAIE